MILCRLFTCLDTSSLSPSAHRHCPLLLTTVLQSLASIYTPYTVVRPTFILTDEGSFLLPFKDPLSVH